MRLPLAALVALLALPACGERTSNPASWMEKHVVKVVSSKCQPKKTFLGSGFLFRRGTEYFVLTSDHVVLHDNPEYCHRVRWSQGAEKKVEFVSAEWGNGLALLHLKEDPGLEGVATFEEISASAAAPGMKTTVTGFPYDADRLIEDHQGSVLGVKKDRELFAFVPRLIELENAHGEFGMSGGPVFDENQKFIGVLSHQILKPTEHGDLIPVELGAEEISPDNHLLLVPGEIALKWVTEYFQDPKSFLPYFHQSAFQQELQGALPQVTTRGLSIWATCNKTGCGINIDVNKFVGARRYDDPKRRLSAIEEYLKTHKKAHGGEAYDFVGETGRIPSLAAFFRKLEEGLQPRVFARVNYLSDTIRKLEAPGHKLWDIDLKMSSDLQGKYTKEIMDLMGEVRHIYNAWINFPHEPLPVETDWVSTTPMELKELFEKRRHVQGWKDLEKSVPHSVSTLQLTLKSAYEVLDELVIL